REVELLTVDDGASVVLVHPGVDLTGRLGPGQGRLGDPDLSDVRNGDTRAVADEHALDSRDHIRVDGRGVRGLAGAAAKRATPVHQSACHTRSFAGPGGHRHRVA